MHTKNILTTLFVICTLQLLAQRPQNELSFVYGGGGMFVLSGLQGMSAGGLNISAGGGFTTFFSPNFGVHVGTKIGFNRLGIEVERLEKITHGLMDINQHLFDLHSTLLGYTETQNAWFFSIPVMFQVQQNTHFFTGNRHGLYAKMGLNLHVLHSTRYTSNIAELRNAGYYPQFGNWVTTQEFAGFGTFNDRASRGDFRLGLVAKLAMEVGMKWRVSDGVFLYSGLFVNYGLNDPAQNQRKGFGDNISSSEDLTNLATLLGFTDRLNPITAGITLRLAFARQN